MTVTEYLRSKSSLIKAERGKSLEFYICSYLLIIIIIIAVVVFVVAIVY